MQKFEVRMSSTLHTDTYLYVIRLPDHSKVFAPFDHVISLSCDLTLFLQRKHVTRALRVAYHITVAMSQSNHVNQRPVQKRENHEAKALIR
jgi:hypothetical protein